MRRADLQRTRADSSTRACTRYVNQLGQLVSERWRRCNYDARAFPEIATRALEEMPAATALTPKQLLHWAATTDPLPPQDNLGNRFGEPSIRLFDDGRFFIQALFWFESTTSIHQHSFSGAFEVLSGSSLHTCYDFAVQERYSEHLQLGALELRDAELLRQGSVRPILAGQRFVHSLFHLDHPSVSFLVRTHNDVEAGPLYSYLPPGIAYNSFHVTPRVRMIKETLVAAHKLGDGSVHRLARAALQGADAETALHALLVYRQLLGDPEWARALPQIEALIRPESELWRETLQRMLSTHERQRSIVQGREYVKSPELRFFLALLLNLRERSRIIELVEARFAERPALDQIVAWVGELWETARPNGDGQFVNLLQFECDPSVKAPALAILRAQLAGKRDKAIAQANKQYRGVEAICQLWREQPFLLPLFE